MSMRELSRSLAPVSPPPWGRELAARALRRASRLLARLARRLHIAERMPAGDPVFEFYAEAGAAEGALYVDGQLVATLPGVTRL
jgi:hypothetical protein